MSKDDMKVLEYQTLNLNKKKEDKMLFDLGIIYAYANECGKGFKVKVYKTFEKGTKFKYEPIASKEDFEKYKLLISAMINKFNKEYILHLDIEGVKND